MSEQTGEKTEQPTQRRLEDAIKRGQFARSPELQTAVVLLAAWVALRLMGGEVFERLMGAQILTLGHLHDIPFSLNVLQAHLIRGTLCVVFCAGPVVIATALGGLLAGGIQSRFQTASEALTPDWNRVDPTAGFKRLFSTRTLLPTALSAVKLGIILALCYGEVRSVLNDPIFYATAEVASLARFLAGSSLTILGRVIVALMAIAAADYALQWWRTNQDLMMTREEVKEEVKSSEGNPQMKARQRRRRKQKSQLQLLLEVPKADVVVTNPTHLAIALRYDRRTMKAPQVVAKGARLNALKIREIAMQHQVPILENKPLARLMYRHCAVGGEIPAQLYAAIAEILAWVYRVNRYRYYAEQNQAAGGS